MLIKSMIISIVFALPMLAHVETIDEGNYASPQFPYGPVRIGFDDPIVARFSAHPPKLNATKFQVKDHSINGEGADIEAHQLALNEEALGQIKNDQSIGNGRIVEGFAEDTSRDL